MIIIKNINSIKDLSQEIWKSITGLKDKKKEIIFVSGWVDVDSTYDRYTWSFVFKITIGIVIALCLLFNKQNFMPVALILFIINAIHLLKNLFFIFYVRGVALQRL